MAGNKLSPRQKMINLMYLVFIAMLALNMSKEVLGAFGLLNEKLETANSKATASNALAYDGLALKASEQPDKFAEENQKALQIKKASSDLVAYIDKLKADMTKSLDDKTDYQVMDKSDYLDRTFFQGDNYSAEGKKFVDMINNYKKTVVTALGEKSPIKDGIENRFNTGENGKVKNRDGRPVDWLNYHYEGFPLISSLTKLTQIQSDVKATEQEVLGAMLQGQLTAEVSMTNYTTLLEAPKSAYFTGEKFDGQLVLGRKDATTKPNRVELTLDGRKLGESEYEILDGRVVLKVNSGNVGEHNIKGNLIFLQDGEELEVPVDQKYTVIPKPNAAVISADKMNVVYRGVANPMTISIPGIGNINANGPGLSSAGGAGKYVMNPGTGREVSITVSGKLPNGETVTDRKEFRIKDIPRPSGTVRGEFGEVKMPKSNLEIATVGALLEDFDFDLNLAIKGFKFKVPGQPTVEVNGNKLDGRAKSALQRAGRGESVQIFDIEAYITNNPSYKLKKVSPVVIELTN